MMVHEYISMNAAAMAPRGVGQASEIVSVIGFGEATGDAMISAPDDVQWLPGDGNPWKSYHDTTPFVPVRMMGDDNARLYSISTTLTP
jgi:hypothetical protein